MFDFIKIILPSSAPSLKQQESERKQRCKFLGYITKEEIDKRINKLKNYKF